MERYIFFERIEILKEYCNYCKDTKKDWKSTRTKKDFLNDFILNDIKMNGIKNLEEKRKEIENALKYNNLTIKHYLDKMEV